MSQTFGQQINRGLDSMRTEAHNPHRERYAAAAERRMLQQQGHGRPVLLQANQQRIDTLTAIIREPFTTR